MRRTSFLLVLALAATGHPTASGQSVPVPAELQYTLIAKVLTFDRNLSDRSGAEIVMGIVYQPTFPASDGVRREIAEAAGRSVVRSIEGIRVRVVEIPLRNPAELAGALQQAGVNLLYVTPLRAVDLARVLAAAREAGALTVTGVPEYVSAGVSLGLGLDAGRPRILVNLSSARREGADLSSNLLMLADVVP
jgi:hypothetical protein